MVENDLVNKRMVERSLLKEDFGQFKTPEAFKKREKIFIVGPPRSGTTLINSLLSQNLFLPECSFISNLLKMFDEIYRFSDDLRFHYYVYDLINLVSIFQKPIYDLLFISSKTVKSKSRDLLVYKDPMLTIYLQYFDLFFMDTYKVIFCVRDPRDTIASMYEVLRKQQDERNTHALLKQAEDFIFPFYYKIFAIDHSIESVNLDRILFIRYEDVVSKEKMQISNLENFIGRRLKFSTRNEAVSNRLDPTSPYYSENYGGLITTKFVGSYKSVLKSLRSKKLKNFIHIILINLIIKHFT